MASEEEELEWIEQPGGWEGDNNENQDENENANDNGNANGNVDESDDDDEEQYNGGFDLFADKNSESIFPFEVALPGHGGNKKRTIKLKLEGFHLESDESAQSTGVTLWNAAPRLARYLCAEEDEGTVAEELIRGKSILELGAGLGLCGMIGHHLGAKNVVLTDADTITLQRMRTNLEKNCPTAKDDGDDINSISCRQLIWNNRSQMEGCGNFDTILGADVIYTVESLDPLFDTVAYFLGNNNEHESGVESDSLSPEKERKEGRKAFVLSRYTKYGNISDETVLDAARARNLLWITPSEGIFVFRRGSFTNPSNNNNNKSEA
jgi:predicted nicotinamide N-methyase